MPNPIYMTIYSYPSVHEESVETLINDTENSSGILLTSEVQTPQSMGGAMKSNHEDQVLVQAVRHNIVLPRDPQSGEGSSKPLIQPLTITKMIDKCSPELLGTIGTGKQLKVILNWYRSNSAGKDECYYKMTLFGAHIVDYKTYMPNCKDPANMHLGHMEDISFSSNGITWGHEICNTFAHWDWNEGMSSSAEG